MARVRTAEMTNSAIEFVEITVARSFLDITIKNISKKVENSTKYKDCVGK